MALFFFFLACTTLDRYTVIPASLVNMYWYVFAKSTSLKLVVFLVRLQSAMLNVSRSRVASVSIFRTPRPWTLVLSDESGEFR